MAGRRPIPTAIHKLNGTYRPSLHGDGEGQPRHGQPQPQGELSIDPIVPLTPSQRALWEHAVSASPRGLLHEIDAYALYGWVVAADEFQIACEQQAKLDKASSSPFLIKKGSGVGVSPYIKIRENAHYRMMKAAGELGFNPAARPKMAITKDETQQNSPWDALEVLEGGLSA